jgi:hypothetical protein
VEIGIFDTKDSFAKNWSNDWKLGSRIIIVHKNFILGAIGNWELGSTQKLELRCQLLRRLGIVLRIGIVD